MAVLVTGVSGLIGGAVARYLKGKGLHVVGVDVREPMLSAEAMDHFFKGDLGEASTYAQLDTTDIGTIVHCAAVVPSSFLGNSAMHAAAINRKIDDAIGELACGRRSKVIYFSSVSVYGNLNHGVINEMTPAVPVGAYAQAKRQSEMELGDKLGSRLVILRVSSPYGTGQRARNVMMLFAEHMIAGENLLVHGSGTHTQDFVSAYDIARAVKCALKSGKNGVFNLASGRSVSMRDLADLFVQTNPQSPSRVLPSGEIDPHEGQSIQYDISKAKTELSWEPKVPLAQGIKEFVEYVKGGIPASS